MDGDPEVVRHVTGPWSDPVAHRAFIEARTRGPYPPGLGYWTICRRDDAVGFVGWVLLIPVDAVGPEIEIGWRLRREAWGRGFATEAARPVLAFAFAALKLPEVMAEIDAENIGSLRVAERLGLRQVGPVQHQGKRAFRYALKLDEARLNLAC
jgi:RimJ/RimL family protein N-acetyltransferase